MSATHFSIPMPVESAPKPEQRGGVAADDHRESARRYTEMQSADAERLLAVQSAQALARQTQALMARQIRAVSARSTSLRAEGTARIAVGCCAGAMGALALIALWRST